MAVDTLAILGIKVDPTQAVKGARKAKEAILGISKASGKAIGALGRMGAKFAKVGTAAVGAFGTLTVKTAGDFEQSMNKVAAVSGATDSQFKALKEQAKELGASTQFSASQAAEAMSFLAMAGFKAEETMGALPGTLQLAASANLDLGQSADIVSNVLSGYRLEVSELGRVNDVLVKTFTSANTDLTQLGEAMKYAGPVASAAGVNFEEVAAAIGLMGNAGIQGSMAGTSLRGAISKILNPSKEAANTMRELGLQFTDSNGRLKSFTEIIQQLEPHADDAGLMMQLFGQRAGPAMAVLAGEGASALSELTSELQGAGGTAKKIADVQMKGMNGAVKLLKSAFEGLQLAVADSGLLEWATQMTTKLASFVQEMSKAGGGLDDLAGIVSNFAEVVKTGITFATEAFAGMWEGFKENIKPIKQAWNELKIAWGTLMAEIFGEGDGTEAWKILGDVIGITLKLAFEALKLAIEGVVVIIRGMKVAWDTMVNVGQVAVDALLKAWKSMKAKVLGVMINLVQLIKQAMDKLAWVMPDGAATAVDGVLAELERMQDEAVGHSIIPDMVEAIGQEMGLLPDKMITPAERAAQGVNGAFSGMASSVTSSIASVVKGTTSMRSALQSIGSSIAGKIENKFIWKPMETVLDGWIKNFANGGRPPVGRPSIVGERGPELFVPQQAGTIVPNGAVGNQVANITFNVQAFDSQSFQTGMVQNRATVVGIIREAFNRNGTAVAI